jgi:hypothetical protein
MGFLVSIGESYAYTRRDRIAASTVIEDNARDRRYAEYNLDRISAALFRDVHPTQTKNLIKEGGSTYDYASAFS